MMRIRSTLEATRLGYGVHAGCLGEVVFVDSKCADQCQRCDELVPPNDICHSQTDDYARDVEFLIRLIEEA